MLEEAEEASGAVFVANKATGQIDRLLYKEPPLRTTKPNLTLPTTPAPSQIRGLLDGNPPSQVIHMASLVLNRLERNVDIDCAPARLSVEAKKRASERRKQIISQREREVPLDPKVQAAASAAKEWVSQNYPALGGMDMALAAVCYQKNILGEQLSGFEKNRLAKIGVRLPVA